MKWYKVKIKDVGRVVTGRTPVTANKDFYVDPYDFVTPSDLNYKNYYVVATASKVTEEARKNYNNSFIPSDSVMFTCTVITLND